jgi:regulator of sigma E protease
MNLFAWLYYVVPFACVLTVLIFVHEMGHYLLARWNGVKVEVFSIGFGRELFGWTDRAGTRWKISMLPLGGYVKMFGESLVGRDRAEEEAGPLPLSAAEIAVAFSHKNLIQRTLIVIAGPAANFLFAIAVTAVMFATFGQQLTSTQIGAIDPGSAAEAAGLKVGDKILQMNGQSIRRFEDIRGIVQLGLGEPLKLTIERGGQQLDINANPKITEVKDIFGDVQKIGLLGIVSSGPGQIIHYDPATAIWVATLETYHMSASMLKAVGQIVTGVRPPAEVHSILGIAKMSGDVFASGPLDAISFVILLSINLGLINLFPIPLLDGGRLLFYAFEAVIGRPLGRRAEEWGLRLGLALVLSLMLFATWNDLVSLKVIQFLRHLFA